MGGQGFKGSVVATVGCVALFVVKLPLSQQRTVKCVTQQVVYFPPVLIRGEITHHFAELLSLKIHS